MLDRMTRKIVCRQTAWHWCVGSLIDQLNQQLNKMIGKQTDRQAKNKVVENLINNLLAGWKNDSWAHQPQTGGQIISEPNRHIGK